MFSEKVKERILWSLRQVVTIRHFIGMVLFIILFTCDFTYSPVEEILMTIVFVIFCTYEQMKYALISGIFIGIILGIFPFLGVIIPFLIIGGVIKNLQFIWKNKYAVYLSMAVIMMPSTILEFILGRFYTIFTFPVTAIIRTLESWPFIHLISYSSRLRYDIIVYGILFNIMMMSLYLMKYSTKEAFTALGILPLLLLALLIPAVMNEIAGAINAGAYDMANNHGYNPDPGTHNVNGYYRTNKYGQTEYIDPHIRTNPDGVEFNNLSYKGRK